MSRFFVDRPVFATVLSIVIVLIGGVALSQLPIAQYPDVAPPVVSVTATYPGANAQVVAETVATPIEQQVNGVENMLYMASRCTNDGQMTLDITFKLGTNIDMAQVLTQNRVAIAEASLPEEVRRQGVVVKKKSPSILLAVNLISPNKRYDRLYLSNYATTQVRDVLARVPGVGDVTTLGARDYSMRVWLDPDKLSSLDLGASDVVNALKEQNVQVAAGRLGQPPGDPDQQFQLAVRTQGRLLEPEEFADVIIKTGDDGQIVRVRDVGHTELGAKSYDVNSYLDGQDSAMMAVFQLPGSNALATADEVKQAMERLAKDFPEGLEYRIVYDTTIFINESIHEVYKTLFEAFLLVFFVVLLFLQDWKATLLPMIDVPVSLIGTFFVMILLGFSLNNLSLFGLVLAIGIVVDDAIVVVENIERWMAKGLEPRDATIKAMDEITGPVIAMTLVLSSVFIPTAFIAGISGEFYRQFALTIAASTIISAINALTMAPARAVLIFKKREPGEHHHHSPLPWWAVGLALGAVTYFIFGEMAAGWLGAGHGHGDDHGDEAWKGYAAMLIAFAIGAVPGAIFCVPINAMLGVVFRGFNVVFGKISDFYGHFVARLVRLSFVMLLVYGGLMGLTYFGFRTVPLGFIPEQDKGYLIAAAQLPDGASLERTEEVMREVTKIVSETPGVQHVLSIPGYNALTGVNLSNSGGMFIILEPFENRAGDRVRSATGVLRQLRMKLMKVQSAQVAVFGAPPVDGIGSAAGFKLQIQDKQGLGPQNLQQAVDALIEEGNVQPGLVGLFTTFRASQPQIFVEIDRAKAKSLNITLSDVNATLQTYLGSTYVNDFTKLDRNWQVNVQADSKFRLEPDDIGRLRVRSQSGQMIPLATLITVKEVSGPAVVNRYQMFPSAEISGGTLPGTSSGDAIAIMERLAEDLPRGMGFEWTELTLQQILAGNTAVFVFAFGTVLVFLVLAAQYESWSLPMAIVMIVPMCLLAAITGVFVMRMDNNIFTQIGLVVLIGLAAKNAILIVEFAKERQEKDGLSRRDAIVDACRARLRPIIMTSLAFILGVVPLLVGRGAGYEMRFALGLAVFSGMLGVTGFGLLFTPVFYDLIVGWGERSKAAEKTAVKGDVSH